MMPLQKLLRALLSASILVSPLAVSADGVICLYKNSDFKGDHICHDGDVVNFKNIRLDDAVSSIKLYGDASVRFFEHPGFRGRSVLVRDNVAAMGPRLDNQFSSMQFVAQSKRTYEHWDDDEMLDRPGPTAGYWQPRGRRDPGAPNTDAWQRRASAEAGVSGVCVYEHWDYKGWERCFSASHANFHELGIDNLVSSVRIVGDVKAHLFEHPEFQGYKRVFAGSDPRLKRRDNDAYSSIAVTR